MFVFLTTTLKGQASTCSCVTYLHRCEPDCMPGLWLLAPGSRGLWLLQPEQNPPIQREHGPLLSLLKPMKKHLMQLQAGTTVKRKWAPVQLCQRLTELEPFLKDHCPLYLGMGEVSMKNHSWAASHTAQHIQRQDVCRTFPNTQHLREKDMEALEVHSLNNGSTALVDPFNLSNWKKQNRQVRAVFQKSKTRKCICGG